MVPVGESIEAELLQRVKNDPSLTRLRMTALVGKQPKASGARIAQSWPIIEVRTTQNYVGLAPSSGYRRVRFPV